MKATLQYLKAELGADYPENEIDGFARIIFEKICGWNFSEQVLKRDNKISSVEFEEIKKIVQRLKNFEPIQYIFGETEFYGLNIKVNQSVLIPRPETEELVDWIVRNKPERNCNILDIGTGSGCIALALKQNLPESKVSATDVSENALKVARQNANHNGLEVTFILQDILNPTNSLADSFDIIVSNPPYVREMEKKEMQKNVLNFEPELALFVNDEDPLVFYNAVSRFALNKLKPFGRIYFEINENLGQETYQLLKNFGFSEIEIKKDINGRERMICALKKY